MIFVVGMWVTVIWNVIRAAKKNQNQNQNQRKSQDTPVSQTPQRSNRRQTTTRQPARRQMQQTNKTGKNTNLQQLLRQNPAELYQTLKNNLPDRYKEEIKEIFNSPNPAKELIQFIRRPDVWPLIQTILRDGTVEKRRNAVAPKPVVPQPIPVEEEPVEDYFEEWNTDIFSSEDSFVPLDRVIPQTETSKQEQVDQSWLKDAVIASIILERPDY